MDGPGNTEFERAGQVLARRLQTLRRARGLSQEQLADKAGVHRTYVGMLERQVGNPSLRIVAGLAWALGVQVDALLTDDHLESFTNL